MNEADITQIGDPVLREKARPVEDEDIGSDKIATIVANMKSALHDTDDGVAIAAPQIGELLRIFVVSGDVFATEDNPDPADRVFINPEIVNTSQKKIILDEGCLSVRGMYGRIERAVQATVRAYDESGNTFELGGSGLLAQIFQHETDHLNGVLFVDKATDVQKVAPDDSSM